MKITKSLILSFLLVLIATLTPGNGKIAGNYLDKIVHIIIFFLLTRSALAASSNKENYTSIVIVCILLGFVTEILQQFIPGRNMEFYDGLADVVGVTIAYYFKKQFNSLQ